MKIRIASLVLALGLLISVVPMVFANEVEEPEVTPEETAAVEETALFYLDGEPLYDVVAQCIEGTYYVTLASMMPLLDATAVVEEDSGMAAVTAEAVVVTEPVAEEGEGNVQTDGTDGSVNDTQTITVTTTTMKFDTITGSLVPVTTTTTMVIDPVTGEYIPVEETEPDQEEREAVVEVVDTLLLTAEVGQDYVIANGRYLYAAGGIITLDGSVAVPVRTLAEALNLSVGYDPVTDCVALTSSEEIGYLEDGETFYSSDAVYWLSRIIFSESGNQSMAGKIAVGNVVLNRVNDSAFPDTIYDVIFQKNQFSPAASGSIHREPSASSVVAAKLVLDGAEVLEDVLFFNRTGLKCYASKNRTFVATIGDHSFYA